MNYLSKLFITAALTFACGLNAQNFSGIATYKSHRKMDLDLDKGNSNLNDEMKKQIYAQLKKQFQKTYFLSFN